MKENKIIRNKAHKILEVKDLVVSFKTDRGIVHAVRGVSFDLYKGETLCIVGESGSGKSVTNKAIIGISSPNAIIEQGSILYEGEDLVRVSEEEFHRIRGHKIGMIFQDPLSALNPVMKVGKQIIEATMINRNILKRHYNELISKEKIKYTNEQTNFEFDKEKIFKEIEKIDGFNKVNKELQKKLLKIDSLKEDKKEELNKEAEKFNGEVSSYIKDTKVLANSEVGRIKERLGHFERKVERVKDDKKIKQKIANIELENIKAIFDLYSNHEHELSKIENDQIAFLNLRKEFLKTYQAKLLENHKKILPLLKEDLKVRKVEAKVENKAYADALLKEHQEKLADFDKKIAQISTKISEFENSLSENERRKVQEIRKHNDQKLAKRRKIELKNKDINVSKTSKDDSVKLEKLPYEELEKLYVELSDLSSKRVEEERDYINKTKITKAEAKRMALEVMKEVGIPLPERRFKQYPFEFSGGMRQRIVIAIALTANPEILICDEPTTALDVTIQAQILELINKLKKERNLSCIFITHDLGVVANMADRVAVMYAGKIVEYGLANEIFFEPKHPYTWALLSSIPDIDSKEKLDAIPGTPPDMLFPPKGDAFALRSKYAMAIDFKYHPPFFKVSDTHYAATWLLYPGVDPVEMPRIVKTRIENSLKEEQERLKKEGKDHE